MTKQEKIREYFESGLCAGLSQEYCSGCNFTRKNGDYCKTCKEQVSETLMDLSELGVVIKVETGKDLTGCVTARLEPLIEEE